jgi:hypothetical protein
MAYDGDLSSEIERFKDYVFPRAIDSKIEERIDQLQARLRELNAV